MRLTIVGIVVIFGLGMLAGWLLSTQAVQAGKTDPCRARSS